MKIGLLSCLAITSFLVVFGMGGVVAAQGCMAGGCHQLLTETKYMHGPVAAEMAGANGCRMCHVPAGSKCTASKAGLFKIKLKGLCVTCHAKGTGTQHSAKEIESKCLNCHSPHGSATSRYMLRAGKK